MKRLMLILAAVPLSIALQVQAGDADSFSIACPAVGLPSQADVVRVFDEHNLGKVYELRQRVCTLAWRECQAGAAFVQIAAASARQPRAISSAGHSPEAWKPALAPPDNPLASARHRAEGGVGY